FPGPECGGGAGGRKSVFQQAPVGFADPFEHGTPRSGDVKIIVQPGSESWNESRLFFAQHRFVERTRSWSGCGQIAQFAEALIDAAERGARALQSFESEIECLAIMRGEEQVSDFAAGKTFGDEIAQGKEISERLAHLAAFNQQMRAVQPVF